MSGICSGLGFIEMGAGSIAASIAGMVFADAGARVIKIEPPEGDRLRTAMPSGFLVWNRGKESLVADLRTAAGQEQLGVLDRGADVVIEGFSPGTTATWGVDAGVLCAANPRLVHCAITGFGTSGPYARLKGYDPVVCAEAGYSGAEIDRLEASGVVVPPDADIGASTEEKGSLGRGSRYRR